MIKTDSLPCHPKYRLLFYHWFVLSKLSWHLIIADLSKTWGIDNPSIYEIYRMSNYYTQCIEIFSKPGYQDSWAVTSYGTNLQYNQFQNTKQVLKSIQGDHEERINNTLLSQGLVIRLLSRIHARI